MPTPNDRQFLFTESNVERIQPQAKAVEYTDTSCLGLILRVQPTGYKCYYLKLFTLDDVPYRWKIGTAKDYKIFSRRPKGDQVNISVRDVAEALRIKSKSGDLRQAKRDAKAKKDRLKYEQLGSFIDHVYLAQYKSLNRSRPEQVMAEIKGALGHAKGEGYLSHHPFEKTRRAASETRLEKIKIPTVDLQYRALTHDEEDALRAALAERDIELKAMCLALAIHSDALEMGGFDGLALEPGGYGGL